MSADAEPIGFLRPVANPLARGAMLNTRKIGDHSFAVRRAYVYKQNLCWDSAKFSMRRAYSSDWMYGLLVLGSVLFVRLKMTLGVHFGVWFRLRILVDILGGSDCGDPCGAFQRYLWNIRSSSDCCGWAPPRPPSFLFSSWNEFGGWFRGGLIPSYGVIG